MGSVVLNYVFLLKLYIITKATCSALYGASLASSPTLYPLFNDAPIFLRASLKNVIMLAAPATKC